MARWIYWGGYVASFVVFFVLAVISCRKDAIAGKNTSDIIDSYAQYILIGILASFASWAMWVFMVGYIIVFVGVKSE